VALSVQVLVATEGPELRIGNLIKGVDVIKKLKSWMLGMRLPDKIGLNACSLQEIQKGSVILVVGDRKIEACLHGV